LHIFDTNGHQRICDKIYLSAIKHIIDNTIQIIYRQNRSGLQMTDLIYPKD